MHASMPDFDLEQLESVLAETSVADYPMADGVEQGILHYSPQTLLSKAAVEAELFRALREGPGVVVVSGLLEDADVIDRATEIFETIIEASRTGGEAGGDHFAKPGANDRIWNSFEKHCLADPANFAAYYGCPALEVICRSWLGPAFQLTAQVNRVNPGGAAQTAHRDYHLGFMSEGQIRAYPPSVHQLSPCLTLQGAIAHVDMPVEAGPTMYLPHSQKWLEGYLYSARPEVQDYFQAHMIQLPLRKGDAVFFNPAVLHGAGANRTPDIARMGNLLQVSSAMGRPMEAVDREAMLNALKPILMGAEQGLDAKLLLVRMVADGYPFPTSLDDNQPKDGLAPSSQASRWQQLISR